MGNACFGKKKKKRSSEAMVHPVVQRGQAVTTIKVRMTRAQLMDLTEKVDMTMSNGNSELGRLIVQECSKGRFHARPAAPDESERTNTYSRGRGLSTIPEHSDEY